MEINIYRTKDELLGLKGSWNELYENLTNPQIFDKWDWFETYVNNIKSDNTDFMVISMFEKKDCVCIAPFTIEKEKKGLLTVNVLKQVVSRTADYVNILMHKDFNNRTLLKKVLETLVNQSYKWDVIELISCNTRNNYTYLIEDTINTFFTNISFYKEQNVMTPFLFYKDLKNKASKKQLKDIERREKRLREEHEIEININNGFNKNIWKDLQVSHKKSWKKSIFKENKYVSFFEELIELYSKENAIEFSFLKVDGKTAAVHFGFLDDKKVYFYIPSYSHEFAKKGVGSILQYHIIHYYANIKKEFDFLKGNEPYKFNWTDQSHMNYNFYLVKKSFKGLYLKLYYVLLLWAKSSKSVKEFFAKWN